jgi:tetratricopeptide (TPR) repeat protein
MSSAAVRFGGIGRGRGPAIRRLVCVWAALVLLFSCLALADECDALFARADALYDTQNGTFDFVAYEFRLRESISLYEQGLALLPETALPTRSATLNRLARAYFELAQAYIPTGPDQEAAYVAGKDYALASLRLDPAFAALEATSFRDALANANDVEGVFWYGTNFGSYLNYHQLEAILGGGMRDVPVCYERAMALDETLLAGAPLRSLGCYLAQVPQFLGGDLVRARELLTRAIAMAPEFLQNAADLSEWVLKPSGETVTLCATLLDVRSRATDPAVMNAWPLYNELALRRAAKLSSGCP